MKWYYTLIAAFCSFCAPASAVTAVTVNCNGGAADFPSISAAVAALKTPPVSGNASIDITGVCTENVVIENFVLLALNGHPGSVIASPNSTAALRIDDSNKVTVANLSLRGGNPVVSVHRATAVTFNSCNVGNPAVRGPGSGMRFEEGAVGYVINTSVSNFTSVGVYAITGSQVTVQASVPVSLSNSGTGAVASNLSSLTISGKVTVENNAGTGLSAFGNSTLLVGECGPGEMAIRGSAIGIASVDSHLQVFCPVVIEANQYYGVQQQSSGLVSLVSAIVRNNGLALNQASTPGGGVLLDSAELYMFESQILHNTGPGIKMVRGARGYMFNMTVQGNSTDGIQVSQGSILEFGLPGSTVTGHPGADLLCNTGANVSGTKAGIGKITCPGFSSESGPKPFTPIVP